MFVVHHFSKYSSKIKILRGQNLYTNRAKESFSSFVFMIELYKVGTSWISRKGAILEKQGLT